MRGIVIARSLGVLLVCAGSARAEQDPPPLSPPALTPPAVEAPAAPVPAPSLPENRPVLVVPGVTAPRARPRSVISPDEPLENVPTPPGGPRLIPSPSQPPVHVALPPKLETIPSPSPVRSRTGPVQSPATAPAPVPEPGAAGRSSGTFRRYLPSAPSFMGGRAPTGSNRSVTVEPRSDPAADAALKRRVERQIQETLGDRVRSVDVRVADRNVTVRARATRFWQRRSVRHSLESLPALTGNRSRVEVLD